MTSSSSYPNTPHDFFLSFSPSVVVCLSSYQYFHTHTHTLYLYLKDSFFSIFFCFLKALWEGGGQLKINQSFHSRFSFCLLGNLFDGCDRGSSKSGEGWTLGWTRWPEITVVDSGHFLYSAKTKELMGRCGERAVRNRSAHSTAISSIIRVANPFYLLTDEKQLSNIFKYHRRWVSTDERRPRNKKSRGDGRNLFLYFCRLSFFQWNIYIQVCPRLSVVRAFSEDLPKGRKKKTFLQREARKRGRKDKKNKGSVCVSLSLAEAIKQDLRVSHTHNSSHGEQEGAAHMARRDLSVDLLDVHLGVYLYRKIYILSSWFFLTKNRPPSKETLRIEKL